ncbi:hypothetical protein Q7A36_36000, partial [Paracraurococcus sp. LOR1-02]|nr:hypothetical protein [Paracraurococcus sp. LOR1-02]
GFIAEAKARGLPHRILFTVPTHKLGAEVIDRLDEIIDRLAALGLRVAPWRGRGAKIDPKASDDSPRMCSNLSAVQDAIDALQDVEEAVCGKGDGPRCPFSGTCAYQQQKAAAATADVVVAPHEVMLGSLPAGIGRGFALVIADEGWLQDGVEPGRVLIAETLNASEVEHPVPRRDDPRKRDDEATNDLHVLRRKMAAAVEAAPDGYLTRAALLAAGLTAAGCTMANKLEWQRKVKDAMRPGMSPEARREAKRRCAGNAAIPRLSALWKAAAALLEGGDEATGRIELAIRDTAEGRQRVILLHTMREVAEAVTDLPMLLLDATLPADLLRHRLPRLELLAEVRAAAPHMRVHQVLGGFGKTSIVPHPETSEDESRRFNRIAELRDFIALRTGGARTLVVTYEGLEPHFADLPGVETAHFNDIAGRDEWGPQLGRPGVRYLFVIGRPLPAPEDTRRLAAALTGRPVPAGQLARVTRGATMRDGTGAGVPVRAYADPDLEAVRAAICDAELVQVIGRGRGINRTAADPLEVYLLAGDVLAPVPLATLTRWEDVAPGPVECMAARGVVLASATDAARAYPDLFPTAEAAKKALQRSGCCGGDFGDKPLWVVPIGPCPRNPFCNDLPDLVPVAYRPAGRGQQTRTAWAHADRLPTLRAWLKAAAGAPLAVFEPASQGEAAAPSPPPSPPTRTPPMPDDLPPSPPPAPPEQDGLPPAAFGMRRVGPGAAAPLAVPKGISVRVTPAAVPLAATVWEIGRLRLARARGQEGDRPG